MITETAEATITVPPLHASGVGYRTWLLTVLMAINMLNLADRLGMSAVAPAMKLDLKLSDTELGLIQGLGFAIFYVLAGLPLARLAEHANRTRIISGALATFACFVLLCSQSRSFIQLLLCRIGVGAGDAGINPPVASLLGDHYPPAKRASVMTIFWLGAPIGAFLGATVAGWVAQHAGWRYWFAGLSVPAALLALLAWFTLREPTRGVFDAVAHAGPPPTIGVTLRFIFAKRSMLHLLAGVALASTAMNGLGQFWGRYYVSVFHIGMSEAGKFIGASAVVGMASGFVLGGFGVGWAGEKDRRWLVWGPAIALTLSAPLFLIGVAQPALGKAVWIFLAALVLMFVYYTPSLALVQNMVGASMRASASFVVSAMIGLVGVGLGPTLTGLFSDTLARRAFGAADFALACPGGAARAGSGAAAVLACQTASSTGIREAYGLMSLLLIWAAVHYLLASRTLERDLDTHFQPKAAIR
jgi:predicted MFS family arabinose efflux permease